MGKQLPPRQQQIIQSHAALIVLVAQAAQNADLRPQLHTVLQATEKNGWIGLVKSIRSIISGERSSLTLLANLDEEDATIIEAILVGIQTPSTLPNPEEKADASSAAPGIAQMVHMAAQGDPQSKIMLGGMADQMRKAGGDMARLAGIMKRLIDGERDMNILCKGMGDQGETLVKSIVDELKRMTYH
jgi:hypothetical protein